VISLKHVEGNRKRELFKKNINIKVFYGTVLLKSAKMEQESIVIIKKQMHFNFNKPFNISQYLEFYHLTLSFQKVIDNFEDKLIMFSLLRNKNNGKATLKKFSLGTALRTFR
jgi:hypothetical protein